MKKVIKAPIIFSLLAASAFPIIGLEPSRAGNKVILYRNDCKLVKVKKGVFKVKSFQNGLMWQGSSEGEGRAFVNRHSYCNR